MEQDRAWLVPATAIAVAMLLWAETFSLITGYSSRPSGLTSLKVAVAIVIVTALFRFLRYLFNLWRSGEERPTARMITDFRPAMRLMAPVVAGVAILSVFLYAVTFLKSMITAVVPFWADPPFAAIDRALLIKPQTIAVALTPALGSLGLFYGLWHVAHLGGIMWVLHWRKGNKARHILSFMLTWAIGMAMAYIFSSAGPIFTGQYDPSLAPESVRKAAGFLWTKYQAKDAALGAGISAFPSMHVAIAAWVAIVLKDRGVGWLGFAFFLGIFACSVILGWHYVIDGVAGGAIALVANWLSQAWLRRGRIEWMGARPVAQASS